uniref:Fe2OG dioxygenase domain-containing protein n=1 Tax=Ananas comosus var. bracteatus TaxID=296719 RepID=A0A6V7QGU2_ANACO|nr:unnamed protein product [Ananas comosus var. bracteatus]
MALDAEKGARHYIFDSSVLRAQTSIPAQFVWPEDERVRSVDELDAPLIDLRSFFSTDAAATRAAADAIRAACTSHGFFQVVNHGVDASLCRDALRCAAEFFRLPLVAKLRAQQRPGSLWGFSGAHADRFAAKLPWKECVSFHSDASAVDYLASTLGNDFQPMGLVCERYSEAMKKLTLSIMELLGVSLGLEREQRYYREFFEDMEYIMRCNYYPPCPEPDLAQGTGPHRDPVAVTILAQDDDVEGLEVFAGGTWRSIRPIPALSWSTLGTLSCMSFVHLSHTLTNKSDFVALSNGIYKSCLHRAVVNRVHERRSIAFFVCPRGDKVVRAPEELVGPGHGPREYPDFTWAELVGFTQSRHRVDQKTLQCFVHHLQSTPESSA